MAIRELRNKLFSIENQDEECTIDDIRKVIAKADNCKNNFACKYCDQKGSCVYELINNLIEE